MKLLCLKMKEAGIDTDSVINRLGGNIKLYMSICLKFINDPTYQCIMQAVSKNNLPEAGMHIHTLKGVAANLGFVKLQSLCVKLLEELKNNKDSDFHKDICLLKKEYCSLISILKNGIKRSFLNE